MDVEHEAVLIRIAENESKFRAQNEKIESTAESIGMIVESVPFVCECPNPDCIEIVRLTLSDYEEIRTNPTRFFCVPGHQGIATNAGAAVVVEVRDDLVLADKIGIAGEIAAAHHGEELVS